VRFLNIIGINGLDVSELRVALENPIIFNYGKVSYHGYEAVFLQKIVRTISKAFLRGQLPKAYQVIGAKAESLDDALSKTGIEALVDEVR